MSARRASPFTSRTALALVLVGALAFVALLWTIGSGMADPEPQAAGGHAGGKGLNGYSALYQYLDARGYAVSKVQSHGALKRGGLLVLTPSHQASVEEIRQAVKDHRFVGPTVLIMPKWLAVQLPKRLSPKVKDGFVMLLEPQIPDWKGFHNEIGVEIAPLGKRPGERQWLGFGQSAQMPDPGQVISARGKGLVPLIETATSARLLAGYVADGGNYPALREQALAAEPEQAESDAGDVAPEASEAAAAAQAAADAAADEEGGDGAPVQDQDAQDSAPASVKVDVPAVMQPENYENAYPLILVFDADLFNNYGMARQPNALMAERLFDAALDGEDKQVVFDLTLAGYGRSENLLELAFTPPFLAATLCLLLAAGVALWRAYFRFGPPLIAARSLAFGKRALVSNAAGLLRRAKRLHLVGAPYADAARDRLAKALALPQRFDAEASELAIDRALKARDPAATSFSEAAAALRAAKGPRDMLRAAQTLHSLERILTR